MADLFLFMLSNTDLITKFYTSFQQLDHKSMNDCYSDHIIFSDPVFGILEGEEVRSMWEMLCTNAKDFSLTFTNIRLLDDEYATCNWTARYTFSKTGRKVINHVKAHMKVKDGKIVEHSDAFKVSKWAGQALGITGVLLGWSNFLKRKIHRNAKKSLETFMQRKKNGQSTL